MAKLSAHGIELWREERMDGRKAYMADGKILRNTGSGWKLHGNWKPGVNVREAVERQKARYEAKPAEYHAYIAALKDAAPIDQRYNLHTAISLMPNDPDGVWSSLEGYCGNDYDLDDLVKACRAYEAMEAVAKSVAA